MKTVLIVITAVAVLTVNCRGFPDQPGNSVVTNPDQENRTMSDAEGDPGHESTELEEVKERKKIRPERTGCRIKRICVALGGFCITDAICNGRVIPEYCAHINCSCCIPGVMEKIIQNLTIELHSMEEFFNQENFQLGSKIDYMEENLIQNNSKLVKEHQGVMEKIIQNLTIELNSIEENINQENFRLGSKIDYMEENLIQNNSQLVKEHQGVMDKNIQNLTIELHSMGSKIDQIKELLDNFTRPDAVKCPRDHFKVGSQCYKIYRDTRRSWDDSKSKCEAEGLVMATKPDDPITLRNYIYENIVKDSHYWIGAKGDNTVHRWEGTGEAISNTDPLWRSHMPGDRVKPIHCLLLLADSYQVNTFPTQPYYADTCSAPNSYNTLCENLKQ